jgi:hypothetical protein
LTSVSIIITNHNYARFLPDAIESALAQTHPDCQVVVVDDGSTDESRAVLERYATVQTVLQDNRGQAAAFNAGFERASSDVVIFLDADDRLDADTGRIVARVFERDLHVAKVMYRLRIIDADGVPTGEVRPLPHLPLRSGDLRPYVLRFPFDMAWTATSGNAFPAAALTSIFPIPEREYPLGADWYLSHLTPLLGEVVFLDQIGGSYRIHDANRYERNPGRPDLDQVRQSIVYARRTAHYIGEVAAQTGVRVGKGRDRELLSVSDLWQRLFSLRLDPERHPVATDTRWGLLMLGLKAARGRFDVAIPLRFLLGAWVVAVALAPRALLPRLAQAFTQSRQQGPFTSLLRRLHYQRVRRARA